MLTQTTRKTESAAMSLVLWGFRARPTSALMRRPVPPMHTALAMASPNKRTKQSMAVVRVAVHTTRMLKLNCTRACD